MEPKEDNLQSYLSIDLIRGIAILLVTLLHSSADYVVAFGEVSGINWWISNIADSFARISVPLFIFISGKLLLNW